MYSSAPTRPWWPRSSVGDGAKIAAGSVIARNVPGGALAMTRAELEVREGWATRYREMKRAKKAAKRKLG